MGIHGTLYAQAHCNPSHQKSLDNQYTHVITYVMLARQITIPSPFPPITSLQAQHYHAIAHSFAQRQPSIPSIFNSFRTLSIATEVVPPHYQNPEEYRLCGLRAPTSVPSVLRFFPHLLAVICAT